jgi:hypothetical protein
MTDPIPFRPRRTLSRYASDKAVKDFERVAKSQGLFIDDKRIMELLDNPNPSGETIEELAKLLGQTDEPKF